MRRYVSSAMILALFLTSDCFATRFIVLITPSGITVGTDSRRVRQSGGTVWNKDVTRKSVLIQERIVIGTIGLVRVAMHGMPAVYEFGPWIDAVERRLPAQVSVATLSTIIEDESRKTIAAINSLGSSAWGDIQPPHTLITYQIYGYDNLIPTGYEVRLEFDRERKVVVGPFLRKNHPQQGRPVDFALVLPSGADVCAVDKITDPQSSAHQEAMSKFSSELSAISSQKDISLEMSAPFMDFLLSLEAECDEEGVAPPYNIYSIPKVGRAYFKTYDGGSAPAFLPEPGKIAKPDAMKDQPH